MTEGGCTMLHLMFLLVWTLAGWSPAPPSDRTGSTWGRSSDPWRADVYSRVLNISWKGISGTLSLKKTKQLGNKGIGSTWRPWSCQPKRYIRHKGDVWPCSSAINFQHEYSSSVLFLLFNSWSSLLILLFNHCSHFDKPLLFLRNPVSKCCLTWETCLATIDPPCWLFSPTVLLGKPALQLVLTWISCFFEPPFFRILIRVSKHC